MAEEKRESTRNLLEDIEGGWESPPAAKVAAPAPSTPALPRDEDAIRAELDAAVDRLFETLDPPPLSSPEMHALDTGWGDDDEDDDEEEEEPEPELPDERLDPVAYAAAKKAREERLEARAKKRRLKLEAKKAKRKARAAAAQQKQKAKKARPTGPSTREREREKARAAARAEAKAAKKNSTPSEDDNDVEPSVTTRATEERRAPSAKRAAVKTDDAKAIPWRLIGLVVAIVVAAALLAAMLSR